MKLSHLCCIPYIGMTPRRPWSIIPMKFLESGSLGIRSGSRSNLYPGGKMIKGPYVVSLSKDRLSTNNGYLCGKRNCLRLGGILAGD